MLSILANPENLRQASLIGVAERLSPRPLQRPLVRPRRANGNNSPFCRFPETDVLASLASAARPRRRNETFYDSAGAQQMGAYRRGSLRRLKFKSAPHKKEPAQEIQAGASTPPLSQARR